MENVEGLPPGRIEDFLRGSAGIDFTGATRGPICVDSGDVGGAAVLLPAPKAARRGARAAEQSRRPEHAPSDTGDSPGIGATENCPSTGARGGASR
jgi:hypothetical protein